MRKALQAARDKDRMAKKIAELESECVISEQEIDKLETQYAEIEQKDDELDKKLKEDHTNLVAESKAANNSYKDRLWELLYNINN